MRKSLFPTSKRAISISSWVSYRRRRKRRTCRWSAQLRSFFADVYHLVKSPVCSQPCNRLEPICITSVGLPNVVAVGNNAEHIQWRGCLSSTRLYACQKTHIDTTGEVMCRLCNKAPESVAHVRDGCTALAQNKYVTRHNAALKILLFEVLQDRGLVDSVPPW